MVTTWRGAGVRGGLRAVRWVGAGLLDQAVIATANAGITLLGLVLLDRRTAGAMVLCLGVGYFAMSVNRAFVGDVLIAVGSRHDAAGRARLVGDGLATALGAGLVGAAILTAVWAVWPAGIDPDLGDLVWVAAFLPAVMLHDTARCGYLAAGLPQQALVIDLVWVGVQAGVVAVMVVCGRVGAVGILVAWGTGAVAGAATYLRRTRTVPWRGRPARWLAATRHLAGWFTATALVGQVHAQAVSFVVAFQLSSVEVSGLRLTQTAVMQPVQNLITAVQGLLVPRTSRLAQRAADAGAGGRDALAALRRQTARLAAVFAGLGGVLVLTVWPVGRAVLAGTGKFTDIAPLVLPVSLQAALYLVQVPYTAAMRGMHRGRGLLVQYCVFSAVGLAGLVIGAKTGRLLGAVWGLAAGTLAGLIVMVVGYRRALRGHLPQGLVSAALREPVEVPEGR